MKKPPRYSGADNAADLQFATAIIAQSEDFLKSKPGKLYGQGVKNGGGVFVFTAF